MHNNITHIFIAFFLSFMLLACNDTNLPQVGKHYTVLPHQLIQDSNPHLPVEYFFSLNCQSCFELDQHIAKHTPKFETDLHRIHITHNQQEQLAAISYYAAFEQDNEKQFSPLLLKLYESQLLYAALPLTDKQQILEDIFYRKKMISPYLLTENLKETIYLQLRESRELSRLYDVSELPTIIIHGQYQVDLSSHDTFEQLFDTIEHLLKKK
ncbi:hypothetical protein N9R79_07695 [Vibrio sp.]|nr:hypothetical protein [Vibrio sp.]